MFDIKALEEEAQAEFTAEKTARLKAALKSKMRELDAARAVVRNMERELDDLKQSIADGSY